jgi:O-antigen ligase
LWNRAWTQFIENPLTGIGPGLFVQIQDVVPTIRLEVYHLFVRGLSAHNLLLHYLAETGIFGGIAVIALMFNQVRLAFKAWSGAVGRQNLETAAIILGIALTFLITTMSEASWLWGQASFSFAFFIALVSRNFSDLVIDRDL